MNMKTRTFSKFLALTLSGIFLSSLLWAQGKKPLLSPAASASGMVHGAKITIQYNSPGVKGRKIWGGLVPYDKFWRGGANKATTFITSKKIMVGGKSLPAGTYTMFFMPTTNDWTVVLNSQTGQWGIKSNGDANFDPKNNVVDIKVKPHSGPFTERLKYVISSKGFSLVWEKLVVPVSIR